MCTKYLCEHVVWLSICFKCRWVPKYFMVICHMKSPELKELFSYSFYLKSYYFKT